MAVNNMQNKKIKTIVFSLLATVIMMSFVVSGNVTAQEAELPGEKESNNNVTKSDEKN